jgi:hypothetical protein
VHPQLTIEKATAELLLKLKGLKCYLPLFLPNLVYAGDAENAYCIGAYGGDSLDKCCQALALDEQQQRMNPQKPSNTEDLITQNRIKLFAEILVCVFLQICLLQKKVSATVQR